jgi:gliding motility-associated protein GldM
MNSSGSLKRKSILLVAIFLAATAFYGCVSKKKYAELEGLKVACEKQLAEVEKWRDGTQLSEYVTVASASRMNVLYRGVDNPMEIAVPGVDSRLLSVSMEGGVITRNEDGTYNVRPGKGAYATINVSANINGETVSMPGREIIIKSIPDPVPSFNGKKPNDSVITLGDAANAAGVRATMESFDFDVNPKVTSFKMALFTNNILSEYHCTGNRLPEDVRRAILQMKKGDRILLDEIMCAMPDNRELKLEKIALTID